MQGNHREPSVEAGRGVRARQVGSPWCHPASQPARVAAASPAGQCLWPLGAISSAGIWIHQCEMKITQSFTLFAFVMLLSLGSKNSCSSRSLQIGGLQSTRPHSATTKDKHGPTATSTKPLQITCKGQDGKGKGLKSGQTSVQIAQNRK